MRRNKKIIVKRLIVFIILFSGSLLLGFSYANWNYTLQIKANARTGFMNLLYDDPFEEKYLVELVDENGAISPLLSQVEIQEEGKKALFHFKSGLPIHKLVQGSQIQIKFKVKTDEDSLALIQKEDVDFEDCDKKVEMTAKDAFMIHDSELYELNIQDDFKIPLVFKLAKKVEVEEKKIYGIILLKLDEESIDKINALPQVITLTEDELIPYENIDEIGRITTQDLQNAIVVQYFCKLDVEFNQKQISPQFQEKGGK